MASAYMSSKQRSLFFVDNLIAITVFTLLTVFSASAIATAPVTYHRYNMTPEEVVERIKPIGKVNLRDPSSAQKKDQETLGNLSHGEKVVRDYCIRCHTAGLMRSPRLGEAKDWAPRLKKGLFTLHDNAIYGINKMPARGGRKALSDADIEAAVNHMLLLVK